MQFMVMVFYRMKSIGQIEGYSIIFLLFCIMNHSREEIEGQKPSKLKAVKRASHMIQGLVVASVVSLSSPAYSQEKKIDAASTTSVATNDVPEYNKILE